ncbi:MAG TPA: serine/threonine-protein kinase [Acidobacteriota bacterium]|jgi:serine/threonine-protein kinase
MSDPVPAPDHEQLLANALADYLDRLAREETVDLEEFCLKHPHLESELRAQIHAAGRIETALSPENDSAHPPGAEELPVRLSGHRVLAPLGSGGMGVVYLAVDESLNRRVAIKALSVRYRQNPHLRVRFMQEARAMAKLSHPNIARIYNLGPQEEIPHFVMEYLEGASLADAAKALPLQQRVELMLKVLQAVDFLHRHQVIHRDLKPGNIMVGPDLEPKVLDFGLALQVDLDEKRITRAGEILGTPNYFSPEQARGDIPLDARSDVFSLGAIFYEILTGEIPFQGKDFREQIRSIREVDPILPRRINPSIPGDLQNVCLKALEKNPDDRYASAREMAEDLKRFLAGESVLAVPASYSRLMTGKIEQHLRELNAWRQDQILSDSEYDSFRKHYDRLVDRDDAWIMEMRRFSLPQVSLYLGAWLLVLGAALVLLFQFANLRGTPATLVVACVTFSIAWLGIRCWRRGQYRVAIAYLLAFCLLLPILLLVAMNEWRLFSVPLPGKESRELFPRLPGFKRVTNAQMWWALLLSLPAYLWLRRFTRASVFSLVFAVMTASLSLVTLLRMGMLEWLETDPGRLYFRLLPIAFVFFLAGWWLERQRYASDSRHFYPFAVIFTLAGLSGLACFHRPYAEWLQKVAPVTRGQIEYLFIFNAAAYLALQHVCDRFPSPQMRSVAKSFRFLIPGHVLTSLLLLGLSASRQWNQQSASSAFRSEARFFEIALPVVACLFVFGSIPKQMKNFFAWGMLFLAIGAVRLQHDLFRNRAAWPLVLLACGFCLTLVAVRYSSIRMALVRLFRRPRRP